MFNVIGVAGSVLSGRKRRRSGNESYGVDDSYSLDPRAEDSIRWMWLEQEKMAAMDPKYREVFLDQYSNLLRNSSRRFRIENATRHVEFLKAIRTESNYLQELIQRYELLQREGR